MGNSKEILNAGSRIKEVVSAVERLCPGRYAPQKGWYTLSIRIKTDDENAPDLRYEFCIETTSASMLSYTLRSLGFERQIGSEYTVY